jgi:SAM-dependent methyltransferase
LSETQRFYDDLAADYHLNYQDWHASVPRHGRVLDTLIRARIPGPEPLRVLDCSCGISTQAIGLALSGHRVTGTDLSPASIERARHEAASFGVDVDFAVADMRRLPADIRSGFDVVISCDNSLPHLQTDAELDLALAGMASKLRPGGLLVVGIRDYDTLVRDRPRFTPPQIVERPVGRSVLFQLWDWDENGALYELTMFVMKQEGDGWTTDVHRVPYRALLRHELERSARTAGFTAIEWHEPPETGHHQPLMTAILSSTEGIV